MKDSRSANSNEIRAYQKAESVAAKSREGTANVMKGAQVPQWKPKEAVSKNFDETVRLQSEKRQEWIREIRAGKLQGIAESPSSGPRLANSSAASFPGRNECPETHFSLIVQEEREDGFCQRD